MQIDSVDEAIAAFATAARRYLAHDRLSVYLLTSDGKFLERFAVATSPGIPGERDLIPVEEVGLTYVLNADLAVVSADLATDQRIVGREDRTIAGAGFHGLVSVPLRTGDQPIGVLNFVSAEVGFYSEEDQVLAQQIADMSAAFFQLLRTAKQRAANSARWPNAVTSAPSDGTGLWDLVNEALTRIESEMGVKTSFVLSCDRSRLDRWDSVRSRAAWRVIQEAVANALRHAHANCLTVSLGADAGGDDWLAVSDNGAGFDVAPIDQVSQAGGFSRMRREGEAASGPVFITTSIGGGSSVSLRFPNLQDARHPTSTGIRAAGANAALGAKTIRILVAAGQPVLRDGLTELLNHQADIREVGRSSSVPETIAQARRLVPDVVLVGAGLVHADATDLVRRLCALARPPKVLLLSDGAAEDRVAAAMAAGAHGYLSTKVSLAAVAEGIKVVNRGSSILDGAAADALWRRPPDPRLVGREGEIVRRVAAGETNAEIARNVNVSEKTVEAALRAMLRKLAAKNRTHLVARALQLGLFSLPRENPDSL